jgi:hypothetical protein
MRLSTDAALSKIENAQGGACRDPDTAAKSMPMIDLTDEKHAAVTAAIRRLVDEDRFPHAPRLDPLRSVPAKLDAARKLTPDPPLPKTPPPTRGGKPARR